MNTLEQWEERLEPFFNSGLRFIGEIPLSFSDVEEMAEVVKNCIQQLGMAQATRFLTSDTPLTLITLMSGFAAHNTQQNYWQAFADLINTNKQGLFSYGWHRNYVLLAKSHRLKVFGFSDDPNPYVTSIRFQGGIPAHSLPDYFERMVLPAVQRPGLMEVQPNIALDYLLKHSYFVDSPVLDFLENSGDLGIEFFSESCKLAKHAISHHGEILPAADVDLPTYVVAAFEAFLERKEDEKQHWRKPELLAAPYSEDSAVILKLPEQEINLDLFTRQIHWQVEWEGQSNPIEIPCRVYRQRQSVITKEEYRTIQATPRTVSISIHAYSDELSHEGELRRWSLPLVPAEENSPLIAFRPNHRIVPAGLAIPAEPLYIVIPKDAELDIVGEASQVEECAPLIGAWQNWKMEVWNLTRAWSVQVKQDGIPVGKVIPVQGTIATPELTGGHLFQFQDAADLPLYTSEVPSLKVPIANVFGSHADLNTWQVHIQSIWEANPCIDLRFKLGQYRNEIKIENERAVFPLSQILGDKPAGTYQIDLHGPRDTRSEFRFRVWPKLMVHGHNLKLVQTGSVPKPSQFNIHLQENARCENQPGAEAVTIAQNSTDWQISAPPELIRVLLDITTPAENGGLVRVPIMVPLPKLRWALATEQSLGNLHFDQMHLHRSIDQLLQSGSAALHVDMYGLGEMINSLKLHLVDLGETEKVIQEAQLTHTDFTRDWLRTGLGQFSDSIKTIHSLAQLELVYFPPGSIEKPVRIPMLELSRDLEIREVRLEQMNETSWKVAWQEDHPLKNRRMMIVPAWQPWQKPWEYKIPDNVRGEIVFEGISLLPSRYHLLFYIMPTWEAPRTAPPENLKPFPIDLCSPQERINAISGNGNNHNDQYKNLIEQACIFDSLTDPQKCGELLSLSAAHLIYLTNLDLLLGSLKWIESREIDPPAIKSFFFKSMFRIEIVETVLQKYSLSNPAVVEYLQYTGRVKDGIPTDSAKLLLKEVDEPIAIYSCLSNLLKRKDIELPKFVITMMEEARLSYRDAIELFSKDTLWAIEKITEINSSLFVDSLIAGLLPKVAQLEGMANDPRISGWMERAIPYVEDTQVLMAYLRHLHAVKYAKCFEILMKSRLDEKITDEDVKEILSLDPRVSYETLKDAPAHDGHQKWIDFLTENYPEAAGIIKPGSSLKTPLGNAKIERIEKKDEGIIARVQIGDPLTILTMVMGEGKDSYQIKIDFNELTITVVGQTKVWKCGRCKFMHPDQNIVVHHASKEHLNVILSPVPLPLIFKLDQIEIN